MTKKYFSILLILLIIFDSVACKNLKSFAEMIIISKDDEQALRKAVDILNQKGGIIFIRTPIINIYGKETINLSSNSSGGIIGVTQSKAYPIIDFKNARKEGSTATGFTISGSNLYMKYLVIENAGGNGISIGGNNNLLDHIITRYNNNSGIQLVDGANLNTLIYCYSYRNIDIKTYGANADGFTIKQGANNNIFKYCFSWDNSNDGWGFYNGEPGTKISFINSACWNNGNPNVFTGKYDYDNRHFIDNKLWTIQQITSSDSSFLRNYLERAYNISNSKINNEKAIDWLYKAESEMNGSGFKFGSKTTSQNSIVKAVYCIAFDHKSIGFDNNNSEQCTGYIENCASFNNRINYQLPYIFEKWSKVWSWKPKFADSYKQQFQILRIPRDINAATQSIYSIRTQIKLNCDSNIFDDKINFDNVIKTLT